MPNSDINILHIAPFRYSKRLQIDLIVLLFNNDYFTMVEEIFENWYPKKLQIDSIILLSDDEIGWNLSSLYLSFFFPEKEI